MTQRHINPVSNRNSQDSQDNPYILPVVGAALGTVVTGISAAQFKKGGIDYASIGFGLGGIGIKGVCDYLLATAYYHHDLREQDADRRNLNGSRSGVRVVGDGELEKEWARLREMHGYDWEKTLSVETGKPIRENNKRGTFSGEGEGEGESTDEGGNYRIKVR